MPNPICRACAKVMRCSENEVVVNDPAVGNYPASYWQGDAYQCSECNAEVVIGFGAPSMTAPGSESLEFRY